MKKILYIILICNFFIPSYAFSMSDKLYNQCLQQNDFKSADGVMTKNWKKLKSLLSESDFKFVLQDQRRWVKNGRENEIEYIKGSYKNINLCSLYAIVSYARANLLGEIANFVKSNPNYTQNDIDIFIHNLDYVDMLNGYAQQVASTDYVSNNSVENKNNSSTSKITDIIIDKAKDAAIEKAVDVGVRWLLKKLIR